MMAGVRGWARTLVWVAILLGCAGVGAFIAYTFPPDPFPPSVRDPASSAPSPTPSIAETARWSLILFSRTRHAYRVGGSCTSDWRMRGQIEIAESGRVRGQGRARLLPGARCDFPSAQIQAQRVNLRIVGRRDGDRLDLRFREEERRPVGSQDLGGFLRTLGSLRVSVPERAGAEVRTSIRIEDPEDEIHRSVTRVELRA
jgi:hypothetical protein